MASLFDLVTAKNVVEYFIETNVNEQPTLGETLFPYKRDIGIKLDWIKGSFNQPIGLRLSAYDAKAIRRDRQGISEYTTKMPFFKESMYIDEELRQQLNTVIDANKPEIINAILTKIFDDQIKLIKSAYVTLERMRMEVLTSGTITLSSNGQSYSYDFGIPDDQKATVTIDWSDEDADIIEDINNIVQTMKSKGVTIVKAVCNNSVIKCFTKNKNIRNQIYVLAGGSISSISAVKALEFVKQETGITFYSYDNVYVDEDGSAHKYIADNTVAFLPEGALGNTHMGTTPEESDLQSLGTAKVSMIGNGIAVATYGTEDPVNVEMKVSMVGLPSFERANEVYILDTSVASE